MERTIPIDERGGADGRGATLLLAPAMASTERKLRAALTQKGFDVRRHAPEVLAVRLGPGSQARFASAARAALTGTELHACRAVFASTEGGGLNAAALPRVRSLRAYVARFESGWLLHLLREHRFVTAFQPLVTADRPDVAFAYECLVRGDVPGDGLIPGRLIFDAARESELMHTVDRAAYAAAMRDAVRHGIDRPLFVNLNPAGMFDRDDCLRETDERSTHAGIAPDRIVLEIVESDRIPDARLLEEVVGRARERGYRFALDDFGEGFASVALLRRLRPEFVKIDAEFVRGVDTDPLKQTLLKHLLHIARDTGAEVVCEGIETAAEEAWAVGNGATYLQGFALARPELVPPRPASNRPPG